MLTNSWLRTGQLYLTHHHIFSPRPTYFARSTFILPVLGLFAPVFCCQSYLLTLTFSAYSTDFVNPTFRGFAVFDIQLYLRRSQKKRVFCRCFCLHCSFDKDFRLLSVLSFWLVCLTVITSCRFYNFNSTIASSQLGNKLSKVAKSSAK